MYFDLAGVLVYLLVACAFVFGVLAMGTLVSPRRPSPGKLETYECGVDAIGPAWVQFNVRFYVIALVFLIFDVEVAVLFPWATLFRKAGLLAFAEMVLFLGILAVGLAYVWVKGDLEWLKGPGPGAPKDAS